MVMNDRQRRMVCATMKKKKARFYASAYGGGLIMTRMHKTLQEIQICFFSCKKEEERKIFRL